MAPRGIRLNNPTNIRHGDKWQGLTADQPDPSFCSFKTVPYGLRAAAIILDGYQHKHNLWTVRQIINRWAPPSENDTDAYVKAVAAACGVKPDETFPLRGTKHMRDLLKAIVHHENGENPYADSVFDQGIELARTT